MKNITAFIFISVFLFAACSSSKHSAAFPASLNASIANNEWVFIAEKISPQLPGTRMQSGYEVRLSKEKLVVYLPYSGRSYSGVIAYNDQHPMDFTSSRFEIKKEEDRKGNKIITVRTNDVNGIQQLRFTVYANGTGSLDATLTNRSPVSYYGYFKQPGN